MTRTVGSHGPTTMEAIRQAGLRLIYRHGYEAMSLRQLAAEVGLQVGSLYNHIANKQELLFDLVKVHMDTLLAALDRALDGIPGAEARLAAFVAFHVTYHIERKQEVFICYSELRSLSPETYPVIAAQRRDYEDRLRLIIADGVAEGVFAVADIGVAVYGILAMLTGVCTWYRPQGRLNPGQIAEVYSQMALGSLRKDPGQRAPGRPLAEPAMN